MTDEADHATFPDAPTRSLPDLCRYLFSLIRKRLWLQVLVAMLLGSGFGTLIRPTAELVPPYIATLVGNWVAMLGRLFLLAIQFVVVPLVELLASVQAVCMVIVGWVSKFAPIAVFGLLASISSSVVKAIASFNSRITPAV